MDSCVNSDNNCMLNVLCVADAAGLGTAVYFATCVDTWGEIQSASIAFTTGAASLHWKYQSDCHTMTPIRFEIFLHSRIRIFNLTSGRLALLFLVIPEKKKEKSYTTTPRQCRTCTLQSADFSIWLDKAEYFDL